MKTIPLTQGYEAIVDDEDYKFLMQWRWVLHANKKSKTMYAVRYEYGDKKTKAILMHRSICNPGENMVVDHINNNGLDNRRSNIRVCQKHKNSRNSRRRENSSSKYIGVSATASGKWRAEIAISYGRENRLHGNLGTFENEEDAAIAYNVAAQFFFGEYANLNPL